MKYVMMLMLVLFVTGCATTDSDEIRCHKQNKMTVCEPREVREPHYRRSDLKN